MDLGVCRAVGLGILEGVTRAVVFGVLGVSKLFEGALLRGVDAQPVLVPFKLRGRNERDWEAIPGVLKGIGPVRRDSGRGVEVGGGIAFEDLEGVLPFRGAGTGTRSSIVPSPCRSFSASSTSFWYMASHRRSFALACFKALWENNKTPAFSLSGDGGSPLLIFSSSMTLADLKSATPGGTDIVQLSGGSWELLGATSLRLDATLNELVQGFVVVGLAEVDVCVGLTKKGESVSVEGSSCNVAVLKSAGIRG